MKSTYPTSAIFGLRYLEEEDLEINDIAGCQTVGANPTMRPESDYTVNPTEHTTYCDVPDYDEMFDQG